MASNLSSLTGADCDRSSQSPRQAGAVHEHTLLQLQRTAHTKAAASDGPHCLPWQCSPKGQRGSRLGELQNLHYAAWEKRGACACDTVRLERRNTCKAPAATYAPRSVRRGGATAHWQRTSGLGRTASEAMLRFRIIAWLHYLGVPPGTLESTWTAESPGSPGCTAAPHLEGWDMLCNIHLCYIPPLLRNKAMHWQRI